MGNPAHARRPGRLAIETKTLLCLRGRCANIYYLSVSVGYHDEGRGFIGDLMGKVIARSSLVFLDQALLPSFLFLTDSLRTLKVSNIKITRIIRPF
jgi:hypothetical protein